ncbi:MAG: GNAT family N-acetyltransferase [Woeseiaceae bacterium]
MPGDAESLSQLAMRSKAHWGYSQEFIDACRAELTVSSNDIEYSRIDYQVAEADGAVVGYYALSQESADTFELEAMFVEPELIGTGVGRRLMQHALASLGNRGAARLSIQSDPYAVDFYFAAGARQVGVLESGSIANRFLPLLEIQINPLSGGKNVG